MIVQIKNLVDSNNFSSVLHAHEDVHHVVQHHGNPVVEEGLPENQVVEVRVYPDLNGFRRQANGQIGKY